MNEDEEEACCMECKSCCGHKPSCSKYDEEDDGF